MDDLDKVIKGLEWPLDCMTDLAKDALEQLKAQEAVKPIENSGFYYCGSCRYAFARHRQKYCSECGRAVKWDG